MSRVKFTPQAEPAFRQAKPAINLSDVDAHLREFAKFSAELPPGSSSKLAVEPQVTLAHDPHDPLALLEQLNGQTCTHAADPSQPIELPDGTEAPARDQAEVAAKPANEPRRDPFEMFSVLGELPPKQV